jgi:ssDNA-binding Zn-finger/Zn-ribbon topoisomerase 1
MNMTYCVIFLSEKFGEIKKMGKLVKIVVCPECGSELKSFEATKFGKFLECCNCKTKVFVPADRACARPPTICKEGNFTTNS